jgi:hypothetical protein
VRSALLRKPVALIDVFKILWSRRMKLDGFNKLPTSDV